MQWKFSVVNVLVTQRPLRVRGTKVSEVHKDDLNVVSAIDGEPDSASRDEGNEVNPQIVLIEGRPMVSSLIIAEHFAMNHKDVLRTIRIAIEDVSAEFGRRNFAPSSYFNSQNKEQPMYQLSKDGFAFVAMGFTGSKAARWKEAYIGQFNSMEQKLLENQMEAIKSTAPKFKSRRRGDGMDTERFADYLVALDGRVNAAKIIAMLVEHKGLVRLLHSTHQELVDILGGSMSTSALAYNCRQLRSEHLLYYEAGRKVSKFHVFPDALRQRLSDKGLHELLQMLVQSDPELLSPPDSEALH
jgi:Rha family phage regulatory protein